MRAMNHDRIFDALIFSTSLPRQTWSSQNSWPCLSIDFVTQTLTFLNVRLNRLTYQQWLLLPEKRIWSAWWRSELSFSDGEMNNGKREALAMPSSWETALRSASDLSWDRRRRSNPSPTSWVSNQVHTFTVVRHWLSTLTKDFTGLAEKLLVLLHALC